MSQQTDYTYNKQCNGARLNDELLAYEPIKSALTGWNETSGGLPVAPITVFTTQTTTTVRCPDFVAQSDVDFVVSVHILNPLPPPPPPPPADNTVSDTIKSKLQAGQTLTAAEQTQVNRFVLGELNAL